MFSKGINPYTEWVSNMQEFLIWLDREQRNCIPKGPCGQDMMTTSGMRGLLSKYPTFEDAYHAYLKEIDARRL